MQAFLPQIGTATRRCTLLSPAATSSSHLCCWSTAKAGTQAKPARACCVPRTTLDSHQWRSHAPPSAPTPFSRLTLCSYTAHGSPRSQETPSCTKRATMAAKMSVVLLLFFPLSSSPPVPVFPSALLLSLVPTPLLLPRHPFFPLPSLSLLFLFQHTCSMLRMLTQFPP